jgi:mannitol-specific phosphotransferase system IIBC component
MTNAGKFISVAVALVVGGIVFFVARTMSKSSNTGEEINERLAKAREAKLAKSILKKSEEENEKSESNSNKEF